MAIRMWPLALLLIAGTCSAQVSKDPDKLKPEIYQAVTKDADKVKPEIYQAVTKDEDKVKPVPIHASLGPRPIPPTEEPTGESLLSIRPPSTCVEHSEKNSSIDLEIPTACCHFSTQECYYQHNGRCKLRWDTGRCDYTVDACRRNNNYWFCTCCASCDGRNARNECKEKGGRCSRTCYKHEYFAWWDQCSSKYCRCCKKYCVQSTCANGRGRCVHSSQSCPRGSYISSEPCKGFGCKCCVPCKYDPECRRRRGFCEWTARRCPIGYSDDKCNCPDKECRCCHRNWIIHSDGGPRKPISVKQSQQMEVNIPQDGAMGPMPIEIDNSDQEPGPADEDRQQQEQQKLAEEAESLERGDGDDDSDQDGTK